MTEASDVPLGDLYDVAPHGKETPRQGPGTPRGAAHMSFLKTLGLVKLEQQSPNKRLSLSVRSMLSSEVPWSRGSRCWKHGRKRWTSRKPMICSSGIIAITSWLHGNTWKQDLQHLGPIID